MPLSRIDSLKIKAKLLQKAKQRAGKPIALKEAFQILAESAGYGSWRSMKAEIEDHEVLRPAKASALWNVWYPSYEEGKAHLAAHGGYLLPYQKQTFVCDDDYIRDLGIDLDDEDLDHVGRDWVNPGDEEAWTRLLQKIASASAESGKKR